MTLNKVDTRNIVLAIIIVLLTAIRLLTLKYQVWSNFTPFGAIAIFGGVYFHDKWKAYVIILSSLFLSDLVINHAYTGHWSLWSSYAFWNCICFSIVILIGIAIKKINFATGIIILLAPVLVHWLIMDLPYVNTPGLYPNTLAGYGSALIAAVPFEKNMLFGDAVFGLLLFGGFELAKTKYRALRTTSNVAI